MSSNELHYQREWCRATVVVATHDASESVKAAGKLVFRAYGKARTNQPMLPDRGCITQVA